MRIAWFGPAPASHGGVPFASGQILRGLAHAGAEVDAYLATGPDRLPDFTGVSHLRLIEEPMNWSWGRWYSRGRLLTVPSAQLARARAQRRLLGRLLDEHRARPYDVIHQFSQFETPWARSQSEKLPPLVVHPEVHAAGELRWHRQEAHLSRRCEPTFRRAAVRANLLIRSAVQRRSALQAGGIIAPSRTFADLISSDYRIPLDRFRVVPNPIDLERFAPPPLDRPPNPRIRLLFVSRISVRKGVEDVVALSHRLADLHDRVEIRVIGEHALFSDYRALLDGLHAPVATYCGGMDGAQLAAEYRAADGLIQPSKYEPFALTVGEGLACGLPVAASTAVGAIEEVSKDVCVTFAAGDLNGFEAAVRELVARIDGGGRGLTAQARAEATRLFAPAVVGRRLVDALAELSAAT